MKRLENKVIVVTGGLGLLGKLFVEHLREQGAIAIAADIRTEGAHFQIACDITKKQSVSELIAKVVNEHSKIDGWVNNAYPRTTDWGKEDFENESMESWRTNVDNHLNGYTLCCQQALNQMKKQGFGSLVNIASIYGIQGPDFTIYEGTQIKNPAAYSAIKGGIINLTRYLAAYYGPSNVRVNCLSPGGIFDGQDPVFVKNYEKKTPLKRMGKPADIAPSVAFLLSDDAAYITGHNLVVDGGWSIV